MIKKICKVCDKPFWVKPCRKNTAKYCSRECKDKSMLGKFGDKNPNWKGGNNIKYWSRVARRVLKKHGILIPKNFDVHHINRNRQDNRIENLQILSPSEHTRLHALAGEYFGRR